MRGRWNKTKWHNYRLVIFISKFIIASQFESWCRHQIYGENCGLPMRFVQLTLSCIKPIWRRTMHDWPIGMEIDRRAARSLRIDLVCLNILQINSNAVVVARTQFWKQSIKFFLEFLSWISNYLSWSGTSYFQRNKSILRVQNKKNPKKVWIIYNYFFLISFNIH